MVDVQAATAKLHAACDECRTRKLKCSRDAPACSRCEREELPCTYSPQKPMGRPRKRRRADVPHELVQDHPPDPSPAFPAPSFAHTLLLPDVASTTDFPALQPIPPTDLVSTGSLPSSYLESFSHGTHPIDPSLWSLPSDGSTLDSASNSVPTQPDNGPCSCLSLNYLALSDLQSLDHFAFPAVIARIRPALTTASTMIHCTHCPKDTFSLVQNVASLNALLTAIAQRFHRILAGINDEAIRLEQTQQKKPFRLGDDAPENKHLHTGMPDCPMSYNLDLDPQVWKKLAKQMLKTEVMGGGANPTSLLGLIEQLDSRQRSWHCDATMRTEEMDQMFGAENTCRNRGEDAMCLRMIRHVRLIVERLDWN